MRTGRLRRDASGKGQFASRPCTPIEQAHEHGRPGRVGDQEHKTILGRDLDGLMALYAEDAILETPLILATLKDRTQGILQGKSEIRPFFEAGLRKLQNDLGRRYRTGTFFSNGRQLTWEYPRNTPQGDQVELVEVMAISHGLIAQHRVYWGWFGFKTLVAALDRPTL